MAHHEFSLLLAHADTTSLPYISITRTQEAYIVAGMLSYTRRYWRSAMKRKTKTPIAERLLATLRPNPKKARLSCRKGYKKPAGGRVKASHIVTG